MTKEQVKALALQHGFQLKEQPDGDMDLHPYVYEFAQALCDTVTPDTKKTAPIKAWGIVFPDNFIMVDSNFVTEARAWRVALGWPSDGEIERAKNNGHRAVLLTIDVDEQTAKPFVDHETEKMNNKDWIAADEVNALVQQLDVLLNGAEGAARQASLCDIVAQVARMQSRRRP